MTDLEAAILDGIERIRNWKPRLPCGSKGNPHLVLPRKVRWPVCVTCGAGYADAALAADMEARGIDTSGIQNIAGETA